MKVSHLIGPENCGEGNNKKGFERVVKTLYPLWRQGTENVDIWKFPCNFLPSFHWRIAGNKDWTNEQGKLMWNGLPGYVAEGVICLRGLSFEFLFRGVDYTKFFKWRNGCVWREILKLIWEACCLRHKHWLSAVIVTRTNR